MFCTTCSFPLEEGDLFCCRCGSQTVEGSERRGSFERALTRATGRKKVAGVCQGFAHFFNVDVTLVRLGWVGASVLPFSPGLVAYMICWAVMPRDEDIHVEPAAEQSA